MMLSGEAEQKMPKQVASAWGVAPKAKAIDPSLDALFATSSGPVKAPPKSRFSDLPQQKSRPASAPESESSARDAGDGEGNDEVLSEISQELDYDDDDDDDSSATPPSEGGDEGGEEQAIPAAETSQPRRERKRKRNDENEELEAKYFAEMTRDDASAPGGKRPKNQQQNDDDDGDDGKIPVHETLTQVSHTSEMEKASRTVFLGNVNAEAISSKRARKTLISHLSSVLDQHDSPPQKFESIRFRSVAFSTGSMPKRAAYITKSLMVATTKSTNAYAVFSSPAAARKVVAELNGTEVLGRHLRVDSTAHPNLMDHRRCVFVGNLGFVDDETVLNTDSEGKTVEKKRSKVPADVEEGLWRTFGKQGRVDNVRVVRDAKTRVGKGIAYVQFHDGNDVEAALLLDGKKFPPMLPRPLRVTRAKAPHKTAMALERAKAKTSAAGVDAARSAQYRPKATPEQHAAAGRASKLLGRAGAALQRKRAHTGGIKTPEQVIFEGRRASAKDARPKDLKFGKNSKGKTARPKNRSARRAAAWKKEGSA